MSTTNSGHAENFVANPLAAHAAENDDHQDGVDRRGFLRARSPIGRAAIAGLKVGGCNGKRADATDVSPT